MGIYVCTWEEDAFIGPCLCVIFLVEDNTILTSFFRYWYLMVGIDNVFMTLSIWYDIQFCE